MKTRLSALVIVTALAASCPAAEKSLVVKAVNKESFPRPGQTIELSAGDLSLLGEKDLSRIRVRDAADRDLHCQAVDGDGDGVPDQVIFQASFAPGETGVFTVTAGDRQSHSPEQFKAHGRLVPERCDDFSWENDRIAHRMYGRALETWAREPLTSSAVDIWSKRTPRLVIDAWYKADKYHADSGEGADFYTAGPSRGCGGSGLWAADRLWVSRNFVGARVLADGPVRVAFELTYEPFDVNGVKVSEVKRITLDAGQNLSRFRSYYKPERSAPLVAGIGLKKAKGEQAEADLQRGWMVKWEPMEKSAGSQGLAVVTDPKLVEKQAEDGRNLLLLTKVPQDNAVEYWAGFCWDKAGHFKDREEWKAYVGRFAQGLRSPIEVSVAGQQAGASLPADASPLEVGKRLLQKIPNGRAGSHYSEISARMTALKFAALTGDEKLKTALIRTCDSLVKQAERGQISVPRHVDNMIIGIVPLEVYIQTKDERYLRVGKLFADKQWENPDAQGLSTQCRFWIDDMYMITILQVQAFRATRDDVYLDRAALALEAYLEKLQQPNGLFHHGAGAPFFWGRGNGWVAAGLAELLSELPADHPRRAGIMKGYTKMMEALLKHQDADGMWHQVIDHPESYKEPSCTAMFTYAFILGGRKGWLKDPAYAEAVRKGWQKLQTYVDANGDVDQVCVGTRTNSKLEYYLTQPAVKGDVHGPAPILWCATALLEGTEE